MDWTEKFENDAKDSTRSCNFDNKATQHFLEFKEEFRITYITSWSNSWRYIEVFATYIKSFCVETDQIHEALQEAIQQLLKILKSKNTIKIIITWSVMMEH